MVQTQSEITSTHKKEPSPDTGLMWMDLRKGKSEKVPRGAHLHGCGARSVGQSRYTGVGGPWSAWRPDGHRMPSVRDRMPSVREMQARRKPVEGIGSLRD